MDNNNLKKLIDSVHKKIVNAESSIPATTAKPGDNSEEEHKMRTGKIIHEYEWSSPTLEFKPI